MKIVQIVGYQNSGKTTLVENMIRFFAKRGKKVGSIKHHGHGGEPDLGLQKDSWRHGEAGSLATTVEGNGVIHLTSGLIQWDVYKILSLYQFLQIETVFIEGYKKEPFPKVVIIKEKEDIGLLEELTNIKAIVCWKAHECEAISCPVFLINDIEHLLKWIWKEVEKQNEKNV